MHTKELDIINKTIQIPNETKVINISDELAKWLIWVFSEFEGVRGSDINEIKEFVGVFEKLRDKYWEMKLIFKDYWAFAKIFEIVGKNWASFVIKIPHLFHLKSDTINDEINSEIINHKRFLYALTLLKDKFVWTKLERLVNNIKIPFIHRETNELWQPMIIMEKISWRTVWYNVISSVFNPLFESTETGRDFSKENDKTIENVLSNLENKVDKTKLFDPGMIEIYPDITVCDILKESLLADHFEWEIFEQIFTWEAKGKLLKDTYEFFSNEFWKLWLYHPDPHMRNFMVTDKNELWVIDFL